MTELSFKKFQSNGLSGEIVKLCLVFYAIRALHKKSRQSFTVSPERSLVEFFDQNFLRTHNIS